MKILIAALVVSVLLNIVLAVLLKKERRGRKRDRYLMMGDFD